MKKTFLVAVAVVSISSINARASDLSYNFIEGIYIKSDTDIAGVSVDGDGFGIDGSFDVADHLAVVAGYEDLSHDFDIDTNSLVLGANYHTPVSETTDVVIGISVIDAEVSLGSLGSEDDTGNVISAGIRSKLNENIEVGASVARTEVFDESATGFSLSLLAGPSDGIQFGVAYGNSDDTDTIGIGVISNF